MQLTTERLILRRFTEEDTQDLYEYLSREEVVHYEPYGVFDYESARKEAVRRASDDSFWAVCLQDTGKLIGNIYFQHKEPAEFMTWEIGYVFNPDHSGQGYATEAAAGMIRYGFQELHAHRIVAECNVLNVPSWKLLERLSMRREATYLSVAFFKRDEEGSPIWFDAYSYGILAQEYQST
jgi:RimJ/RimL family protein N-acetyltransferase